MRSRTLRHKPGDITITISGPASTIKSLLNQPAMKFLVQALEAKRPGGSQDLLPESNSEKEGNLYRAQLDYILGRLGISIDRLANESGVHRVTIHRLRCGGSRTSKTSEKIFRALKKLGATDEEINLLLQAPLDGTR